MPDPNLNNFKAEIRVHRVKPVYPNGKCPQVHNYAAVMVHGRSSASTASFDMEFPGLTSPQELLARAGIDTFSMDLLGYGYSSRLSLDDPCNASYPAYDTNGTPNDPSDDTCAFERCDRSPNAVVGVLDLQRKPAPNPNTVPPIAAGDGVRVNPLEHLVAPYETCEHSSDAHFANPDVWARDIHQVIDDAIEKAQPKSGKVVLLGYSLGGPRIARALYLLGNEAGHKVKRVVFQASLFNLTFPGPVPRNLPNEEAELLPADFPTFPLSLGGFAGIPGVGSHESFCGSGRLLPGLNAAFQAHLREQEDPQATVELGHPLDLLGLDWGGSVLGTPTGLSRLPTFTNYGWNPEVAASLTLPTLIVHGLDDTIAPVQNSLNIFNGLTSLTHKVLVQVDCSGHQMMSETCDSDSDKDGNLCEVGERCCTPDSGTIYGSEDSTWDGPHSTLAAALIEWVKYGTFDDSECGHFVVNASGVASEVATPNCPMVP